MKFHVKKINIVGMMEVVLLQKNSKDATKYIFKKKTLICVILSKKRNFFNYFYFFLKPFFNFSSKHVHAQKMFIETNLEYNVMLSDKIASHT